SLDAIGEALEENGRVIVTGCLGAKGDVVRRTHPKVLAVTGPHALEEVMTAVHEHLPKPHDPFTDLVPPQGIKLTPRHYAYLKLMKRPASGEDNLARIRAWRTICPDITIRSTFIAGFPGETEDEFRELLDFLEAAELDRVGCFAYSPVQGAKANELPGALSNEVREERRERLMHLQEKISARRLKRKVGKTIEVLVDEVKGGRAVGRSAADAPEIDGVVHIEDGPKLKPGDWTQVKVLRSDAHDLWASEPAGRRRAA